MALRIWDTATADYRDATQVDIDELLAFRNAYSRIQDRFSDDRGLLVVELTKIRSRAGQPNDLMAGPLMPAEPEQEV